MTKPLFEHEICTRCLGGGEYSYNAIDGTRCYGCLGLGYRLTARGRAAQTYLNAMRKRPAEQVKVGDLIRYDGTRKRSFRTVTAIEAFPACQTFVNESGTAYRIVCGEGTVIAREGQMINMGFTGAEKAEQQAKALSYQATLTKAGKPSKKSTRAEEAA
jgi:hypothetical protein